MTDDIKEFAREIKEKAIDRRRKKGGADLHWPLAIEAAIDYKMRKEGWVKAGISSAKPTA